MRNELLESMPILRSVKVLERFEQQVKGMNYENIPDASHRLWNIEISKKDIKPVMEIITLDTLYPKWNT